MSRIDDVKEHLWRGLAMTKLLKELGWAMQQYQHLQPGLTFTELNPEAFRYVVAILADELEAAVSLIDQVESAESDANEARAPACERHLLEFSDETNKKIT
jgi:hypothetical protein